jgi:peptide/nickel transport system permease protein
MTDDIKNETETGPEEKASSAEKRISVATQWQLMRWRFFRHRLAIVGVVFVLLFYLVVIGSDFLAYSDPNSTDAYRSLIPPQPIHWFDEGGIHPYVHPVVGKRSMTTFQLSYVADTDRKTYLRFFVQGYEYRFLGFIPSKLHLIGVEAGKPENSIFLLGTDVQGRDMWSRLMVATSTSLTIGLVAVVASLVLGVLFGGISGFAGGAIDTFIQRVIEVLRAIPTIPLWMGLAAALPPTWNVTQVYFAITIIISLIGWTELARQVRGQLLSLRHEDFVLAAELVGCSRSRIIFRHLVPSFLSHIIATTTLALPAMILSETSLSFLGLGLRPPAISWGVMLQQAQNLQALSLSPWLLIPAIPVIIVILAFNFFGDGLRDAADPYG